MVISSLLIVQYSMRHGQTAPPFSLTDPHDRAVARFWGAYVDDKWFPLMLEVGAVGQDAKAAVLQKIIQGLCLLEEEFANCSKGKTFFGGDYIGYMDIDMGCFLGWIRATEMMLGVKLIHEAKTPGLVGWAARFLLEKAVKNVILEPEKLIEIYKFVQAKREAANEN